MIGLGSDKKIAMQFSENEGRVKGRLKLFRKFIRFGVATCPLVLYYISMTITLIALRLLLNALMSAFGSIDGPINLGYQLWVVGRSYV